MAYNTYLIDNPSVANQYTTYLPVSGGVTQNQSTQTSGGSGETVLTFGGNYNDKVYVGFTLGIPHINYSNTTIYTEKANDTVSGGINSFSLNHQLTTTGIGVDFKMGLIYRVFDWMRLGFAYHSPTYYSMHDDYSSSITTNFTNNTYTSSSPSGANNYQLITPSRVIGSVGFVVAQRGLIGLDYEYINYAQSSVSGGIPSFDNSSPNGNFNSINTSITQQYQAASNIRLGLEWRLDENITIRGGYAIYGNPYQSSANIDASRDSYTAGIGFRTRVFYCDLAYVLTQYKENYYMFNPSYSNLSPVTNSFSGSSAMMTFGFKF